MSMMREDEASPVGSHRYSIRAACSCYAQIARNPRDRAAAREHGTLHLSQHGSEHPPSSFSYSSSPVCGLRLWA